MINDSISDSAERDGMAMRRTRLAQAGHVIFGPYMTATHGVYQVDFTVALVSSNQPEDAICATLDVCSDFGFHMITERQLRRSELSIEPRTFSLLFVLRQIHSLEYRIHTAGNTELLVGADPVFTRISAVLDEPARPGLPASLSDPEEFGRDTRRILSLLRPYALRDHKKVRLGNPGDGGYVCIDDFAGIDTAFSFGINDDISWDLAAAEHGLRIYQFDHTVSDPAPDDPRMVFEAKRIDSYSGPDSQSLSDLVRAHDKGHPRPNIVLKMDIEGWEWSVIAATPPEDLARIAWIVCEMHYFQGLAEPYHRELIDSSLRKIAEVFALVHIHGNVWGGITSIANTIYPNVIEATFANRSQYTVVDSTEIFPGPMDRSCDPQQPDFYLGSYRF